MGSRGRDMPYPTNHGQEQRTAPETHHAPSFIPHHLPQFSRKLWIAQVQYFRHFLCTPNEKSGSVEFGPYFWDPCIKKKEKKTTHSFYGSDPFISRCSSNTERY
ncbi:hypothetical protein TNCV_1142451 [Trichonephila clavipes]|nr:hypothetical protein TNCV_1142451 [Trichonephila clavipes]